MNNKKGFLLGEHGVDLIIVAICAVILVGVGVVVYNSINNQQDLTKAKNTLQNVLEAIDSVSANSPKSVILTSPYEWAIISWSNVNTMPFGCEKGKDCICICDFSGWFDSTKENQNKRGDYLVKCNDVKKAICKPINNFIAGENLVWFDSPTTLKISIENNGIKMEKVA